MWAQNYIHTQTTRLFTWKQKFVATWPLRVYWMYSTKIHLQSHTTLCTNLQLQWNSETFYRITWTRIIPIIVKYTAEMKIDTRTGEDRYTDVWELQVLTIFSGQSNVSDPVNPSYWCVFPKFSSMFSIAWNPKEKVPQSMYRFRMMAHHKFTIRAQRRLHDTSFGNWGSSTNLIKVVIVVREKLWPSIVPRTAASAKVSLSLGLHEILQIVYPIVLSIFTVFFQNGLTGLAKVSSAGRKIEAHNFCRWYVPVAKMCIKTIGFSTKCGVFAEDTWRFWSLLDVSFILLFMDRIRQYNTDSSMLPFQRVTTNSTTSSPSPTEVRGLKPRLLATLTTLYIQQLIREQFNLETARAGVNHNHATQGANHYQPDGGTIT